MSAGNENHWKSVTDTIQGGKEELADQILSSQSDLDPEEEDGSDEKCLTEPSKFSVPSLTRAAKVSSAFNSDGTIRSLVKAPKSAFVHNILHLDGVKFDFTGREYLMPIYNRNDRRILLKTARQVEKSTFLANNLTINSVVRPFNKALYVSPSHMQTRQFSSEKLKPTIERSPLIWRYLQDNKVSNQVFEKGFTNGAFIFLRSAFRSADRTRGISARELCYDKDAFVLTKRGWTSVVDLSLSDKIADVNDKGEVEWSLPSRLVKREHTGKMVSFSHTGFSVRVTDDHNMWANHKVKKDLNRPDKYEFKKAIDLATDPSMGFKMTCKAGWGKEAPAKAEVNGLLLPYLPFCSILGWYATDGSISHDYATLSVSDKKLEFLRPALEDLGLPYNIYPHSHNPEGPGKTVFIFSKPFGRYLKKLGTAYFKHIPREFIKYSDGVEEILKGVYRGDACYHAGEQWLNGTLRTRSRQLAEDVQECWLRLQRPAVIHTREVANKALNLTPDVDFEMKDLYEVSSYNRDYTIFWKADREKRISVEDVEKESVFCFTVKNHRPIVKGNFRSKPVISGNCLDEIQDLLTSDIPVIMECTSHFDDSNVYMAGTPKSFDNPIEQYWKESTQNEWLVPCGCGEWNFLDETNIAPTAMYVSGQLPPGPVCSKCMKPLNVKGGQWMSLSPGKLFVGYRIPQLMVPWIISTYDQWYKLLWKRDHYPFGQFCNEVLGLSYDSASKPISRAELLKVCHDYSLWDLNAITPEMIKLARNKILIGGVDWGEGMDGSEKGPGGKTRNASYTVLSLGYYETGSKFKYIGMKKYMGKEIEPEYIVDDLCRIVKALGVRLLGVDWGHGWGVNNALVRKLGIKRVMLFQYLPRLKTRLKWDSDGMRYHIHRNLLMSEHFYDMKNGHVMFPKWEEFEPYAKDILAIYSEYNDYLREMRYDHKPSDPDDAYHSTLLCKTAADIFLGKSRSYTDPNRKR